METKPLAQDALLNETDVQEGAVVKSDVTKEVVITRTPLIFSRIYMNTFQKKGTKTLEVKQQLVTDATYTGIKITNTLNDSIYDQEDFKEATKPREYQSTETRVAWILVPASEPDAKVMKMFKKYEQTGIIFKILSNSPVFDENQLDAIERGLKTYDEMADKQAVRYGANDPNGNAGKLILDKKGNAQYKRTGFSKTARADEDRRFGLSEVYQTPRIKAEMEGAGALLGQTV